jgi:hypothetical protein
LPGLRVPLQATDLLLVSLALAKPLLGLPYISVIDDTIPGARCEYVLVPGKSTNPACVTSHGTQTTLRLRIPDLHEASIGADCDV